MSLEQGPYQQVLPLQLNDRADFDTFISGPNEQAVEILKKAVQTKLNEFFLVFGPPGCGKTHLLNALYRMESNSIGKAFYLDLKEARKWDPLLLNIDPPSLVILDNADALAKDESWELALFALFNRWYDKREGTLIISSKVSFDKIPFLRHDLNTRLGSGVILPLNYLNEEQCIEALKRRAQERAFSIPNATCAFLVRHFNRDMSHLFKLLDKLDEAQFNERHQLTIPFVKKVLTKTD